MKDITRYLPKLTQTTALINRKNWHSIIFLIATEKLK
jgi:hypothetical protein